MVEQILKDILQELKSISNKLDMLRDTAPPVSRGATSNIDVIKARIDKERESVKRRNSKENERFFGPPRKE
jgi:hypothetical protein